MDIKDLSARIAAKIAEIKQFRDRDLPDIVGTEAVNHYKENFANEGFTDQTNEKWQDVKRRDPNSPWYGFSYKAKKNFSESRTTDKILTGETKELQNSIDYEKKPGRVTVYSDKKYAAVHQFGLQAKIFGKKPFKMPARPFIGKSAVLEKNIHDKIQRTLNKIINS